jgi:hypothetical protein
VQLHCLLFRRLSAHVLHDPKQFTRSSLKGKKINSRGNNKNACFRAFALIERAEQHIMEHAIKDRNCFN